MRNDGSFDLLSPDPEALPGSDGAAASLSDSPGVKWEVQLAYSVDVLDVPVCIDQESTCKNSILGYYRWGWFVAADHIVKNSYAEVAQSWYTQAFPLAVDQWNAHTAGSTRLPFPDLKPLSCSQGS